MTWLTWRQFRTQAYIGVVLLVAALATVLVNANLLGHLWSDTGAAACAGHAGCRALDSFLAQARVGTPLILYVVGTALLYLVPPLIGVFWGAPLVARELEAGTHRLTWNQSVTRSRWLAVKLLMLGGTSAAFAGVLSLAVSWSSRHLDYAGVNRISPLLFGARGVVPIGYAVFALTLGVAAGILIRRTVPAMAATLGVYIGAVGAMTLWGRAYLIPPIHLTKPLGTDREPTELLINPANRIRIVQDPGIRGAWVIDNQTLNPDGTPFTGPGDAQHCGGQSSPKACLDWIHSLGLNQAVVYQPAGRFWALQWAEVGVFLALAAVLVTLGFWWLGRRLA